MTDQRAPYRPAKRVHAIFFREESGSEPVRKALLELTREERREVGKDLRTVQYGWPIGMPTCRSLGGGLHEVRTRFRNRLFRVLFRIDAAERLVLLHGFVKKTEATPRADIDLAERRWAQYTKESGT